MNNVAFLGTGLLGSAMVERMLAQGDSVTIWNRTVSKAQALQPAGAAIALTAGEAVGAADHVHLALTDDAVVDSILAAVALERKDANHAIEQLKDASAIELGQPTGTVAVFLCPAYVRGEAYLMLLDGKAAAEEFQKFIDHRGIVVNFPWGALARLGLARAYALQGNTAKAKAAYQDFLTLWKDADPDLLILIAAKAEYAKLQ